MIGTIIGITAIVGALTTGMAILDNALTKERKEKKAKEERRIEERARAIANKNVKTIKAKAKRIAGTMAQKKKIDFFDSYRALDIKTARLAKQGSGGITLLINAIRHNRLNNNVGFRLNDLVDARNRRNAFAHHKEKWSDQLDPSNREIEVIQSVSRYVSNHQNAVAKAIYKEHVQRSKRKGNNYRF